MVAWMKRSGIRVHAVNKSYIFASRQGAKNAKIYICYFPCVLNTSARDRQISRNSLLQLPDRMDQRLGAALAMSGGL